MEVAKVLVSVCNEIGKIQKNFIWGSSHSKGFHPITWSKVSLPKTYGRLGFKKLSSVNEACSTKLAWQVVTGN